MPREQAALRVMVVEDNLVNQRVSTHMLTQLGHEVTVVPDGLQALARLAHEHPDVVLMDVHLPGLDGLEVTRRVVGALPPSRRPWIIALTAGALSGDRDRCLAPGMDDYLSKPVSLDVLAATLGRVPRVATERTPALPGGAGPDEGPWRGLDREVIEALATLGAQTRSTLLTELIHVFLDEAPQRLGALEAAVAVADAAAVRHIAHSFGGSCATLGASGLAGLLLDIELAARDADVATCVAALPGVRAQLASVEVAMRQLGVEAPPKLAQES